MVGIDQSPAAQLFLKLAILSAEFEYSLSGDRLSLLGTAKGDHICSVVEWQRNARQEKICFSTALLEDCEFLTRNEEDFNWISELKLVNPI
ncbi:MAG: hypothetical protein D6730_10425 [Bacteroidetes bacterium]|nr:MAG: hypothetical protein D6730_10425 [Bacteroidota bacterium]